MSITFETTTPTQRVLTGVADYVLYRVLTCPPDSPELTTALQQLADVQEATAAAAPAAIARSWQSAASTTRRRAGNRAPLDGTPLSRTLRLALDVGYGHVRSAPDASIRRVVALERLAEIEDVIVETYAPAVDPCSVQHAKTLRNEAEQIITALQAPPWSA